MDYFSSYEGRYAGSLVAISHDRCSHRPAAGWLRLDASRPQRMRSGAISVAVTDVDEFLK